MANELDSLSKTTLDWINRQVATVPTPADTSLVINPVRVAVKHARGEPVSREEYLMANWPEELPGECTDWKVGRWCLETDPLPIDACESCKLFVKLQKEWQAQNILRTVEKMREARKAEWTRWLEDLAPEAYVVSFGVWLEKMNGQVPKHQQSEVVKADPSVKDGWTMDEL